MKVVFTKKFVKCLEKLDTKNQKRIKEWINTTLYRLSNPKDKGKNLLGDLKGKWRYRVGDYRIIAIIHDKTVTVYLLEVEHRKDAYKH